ncbi:MAG: DNA-formamidopyrimidine glycosylase, partial [Mucilaginibacter sp.]|nr:DNA-formamidopyrimidine glycosylase [Mucilaginibacter sp.]
EVIVHTNKLNVTPAALKKALENQELKEVRREGKELYFEFKDGTVLSLHLMLRGQLYLDDQEHQYSIIELLFDDGLKLTLTDFQKAATPTLNPEPKEAPDALDDEEVNFSFLKDILQAKKSVVKNILLDQHIIRGIGNAYADEILWDARISPFSISNKIPENKIKDLAKSIRSVLKNAEQQILKTHPDIISGEVRDFLNVHHPHKKESPAGGKINIKAGTRKTYYTNEQELFE